jgi:hypothetical protein
MEKLLCPSRAPAKRLRRTVLLLTCMLAAAIFPVPGRGEPPAGPANPKLQHAVMARIDSTYAVIVSADGARSLLPLKELSAGDRAWLEALAAEHPLAHGNSKVITVATTDPEKKTILVSKTEGAIETVQLCPPNVFHTQTASFCALYARIHWLDIAGYYVKMPDVYKVEGIPANQDDPWSNPRYGPALDLLVASYVPAAAIHDPPSQDHVFDWIRAEVRKGRPVFAALTHEIWQALPPKFIAAHGWDGGKEGHAIVINGFTWNNDTNKGSFHIINSWEQLYEFDLPVENAEGMLAYPRSLTPKGKIEAPDAPEQVTRVTLLQARGSINIYQVETNLGLRRVAAPNEAAARALIEAGSGP